MFDQDTHMILLLDFLEEYSMDFPSKGSDDDLSFGSTEQITNLKLVDPNPYQCYLRASSTAYTSTFQPFEI